MPVCPTKVYHAIAGFPVGGQHMVMPPFPTTWGRAYNIYEGYWGSRSGGTLVVDGYHTDGQYYPYTMVGGTYNLDRNKLERFLDLYENANALPIEQVPYTHSAGPCEPNFTGPMVLDMEAEDFRQNQWAFREVWERMLRWRPHAKWMFYGSVSKWASQWDTPASRQKFMSLNNSINRVLNYVKHKHIPLYLKSPDSAAQWEIWNEKNAMECVRSAREVGGTATAIVGTGQAVDATNYAPITTLAQALAQVRPAIRHGMDIQVWWFWRNNAERDADLTPISLIDQAINQARAELWGE